MKFYKTSYQDERGAKRNPEEETLRALRPKKLPQSFSRDMKSLAQNAAELKDHFTHLWLTRNKPSRLADILKEFDRLISEYQKFARS